MKKKIQRRKLKADRIPMPKVARSREVKSDIEGFPLPNFSYSSWSKFCTNPFMFKVNNLNGDYIDSTSSPSNVLGKGMHEALKVYLGGSDIPIMLDDEGEAIKIAHQVGMDTLNMSYDGLIEYNTIIKNREKLNEKFAFSFFEYLKDLDYKRDETETLIVEKMLLHKVEIDGKVLPIPLKGKPDLVYRQDGKIIIKDHKFTSKYSDADAIDAGKLIQAAFMYFLVYAELGEAPYSIIFSEFKFVKNDNGDRQTRDYEIVYAENHLIFDFFFRLYGDITDALLGKQVYVPNFNAYYDKEVAILSYIHRLDIEEERAEQFKKMKVDNITDFLKKKIQATGAMEKYLKVVSSKFISAKTMNYKNYPIEERIRMKLAEHGLALEFVDKIVGSSVELYRYEPSLGLKMSKIEGYVKDIEQVVEKSDIRVLAPIPDSGYVGFEVPREERSFPEMPGHKGFEIAIGETIMGKVRRFDIRKAPHILYAGSSGSGKSVGLISLISQLLSIPRVELHLFDPKQVELAQFEDERKVKEYHSHHASIALSLESLVDEMEDRYKKMKAAGVKNIDQLPDMKYKFVIIDEFADLRMKAHVGSLIQTLAQKGRACGIHLVIATQRASAKIISGDIKVNFPVKVVFQLDNYTSSRVMLDEGGAEKLKGMGDMLFVGDRGIERLQGYKLKD